MIKIQSYFYYVSIILEPFITQKEKPHNMNNIFGFEAMKGWNPTTSHSFKGCSNLDFCCVFVWALMLS